jgi:hypothetical protein
MSYVTYAIEHDIAEKDALVIIERPHQGPSRVWYAYDESDFIERVESWADHRRQWAEISDFDSAYDYLARDLSSLRLIRFADILCDDARAQYIEIGGPVLKAMLWLNWIVETDEKESMQ